MDAYARLTHELTNMSANERTAFDTSDVYASALEAVREGRDDDAIDLIRSLQSAEGDVWRAKAFEYSLIATPGFVA